MPENQIQHTDKPRKTYLTHIKSIENLICRNLFPTQEMQITDKTYHKRMTVTMVFQSIHLALFYFRNISQTQGGPTHRYIKSQHLTESRCITRKNKTDVMVIMSQRKQFIIRLKPTAVFQPEKTSLPPTKPPRPIAI